MKSWYLFTLSKPDEYTGEDIDYVKSIFEKWFYWPRCFNDGWNLIIPNVFELFWIKEEDNIYFFINRKIYWIWKVIKNTDSVIQKDLEWNYGFHFDENFDNKFLFSWIDMDELLSSDNNSYSMIRSLDWVSFIKLDIEENLRLRWFIYNKSEVKTLNLSNRLETESVLWKDLVNDNYYDTNNRITNEKVIETWFLNMFINYEEQFSSYFWDLDYLSSQIPASPQKPVRYMDKMDLFWYKLVKNHILTKSKYIIIELKKGLLKKDDIYQLLKYVDYVSKNYCWWDYWMIDAYLVWASYIQSRERKERELLELLSHENNSRHYVLWRELEPTTWSGSSMKILNYKFNWDELIVNNVN